MKRQQQTTISKKIQNDPHFAVKEVKQSLRYWRYSERDSWWSL